MLPRTASLRAAVRYGTSRGPTERCALPRPSTGFRGLSKASADDEPTKKKASTSSETPKKKDDDETLGALLDSIAPNPYEKLKGMMDSLKKRATESSATNKKEQEEIIPEHALSEEELDERRKNESVAQTARRVFLQPLKSWVFDASASTWRDAVREVFGMKAESTKRKAKRAPKIKTYFSVVDEETGDRYYFMRGDETSATWDRPNGFVEIKEEVPDDPDFIVIKPPIIEEEVPAGPHPNEEKIATIGLEISKLETVRENAQLDGEMDLFKQSNKEIRSLKREIERLTKQMNTNALVVLEEEKRAWDQFSDSIKNTPLVQAALGFQKTEAGKRLSDATEDMREAWETSQNPWVYRAHETYHSVFAETDAGEAVRELRKIDANFTSLEDFVVEMEEEIVPEVLGAFLQGDEATLGEWCSEAAAAATRSSIQERKKLGRVMDPNILALGDFRVLQAKNIHKLGPIVVVQFMAQQINCLRDLKGEVVEGKDDEVVASFYAFALTKEVPEELEDDPYAEPKWVVKEFALVGNVPYI